MRISDWSSDVCSSDLPGVADQLQHVDFLVVLAGGLDDDLQRAAVGQQAIAVAVALGQADLVDQRVGFRGVEGGLSLAVRRLVERAVGQRSEERRVGKECARSCRSWWTPYY